MKNPEFALLSAMIDASPYMVPESTLVHEVQQRLSHSFTRQEFDDLARAARERKRLIRVDAEDGPRYKLTAEGQGRFLELKEAQ